jgi:hypothetical protein
MALYLRGLMRIIVVCGMNLLSCRAAGNIGQDAVSHKDVCWVWYEDVISKSSCHLLPVTSIHQPVSLPGNVIHICGETSGCNIVHEGSF